MSSFQPINPKPFIKSLIGQEVVVRLKWNKTEYRGQLMSTDNYLNLQLDNTFEIIYDSEDKFREEEIGSIFIRCNNVLFIREYKNEGTENNKVPVTEKSASVEEADKSNNGEVGASGEIDVAKVELKEAEMEG
ncbi:Small nuclear ribonucleoprotein F domain protein [Candida parapsilosis]|uniref:Sm protein F n=1 Tax=Candida parapsilosis TaxID=5480 RepID=A0A8X7NHS3_CANPA|nr:Small nuclear ribonucleoprotein F domain protein [Candida parapsilosis]KAF6048820.1 Small nuclear ribonucleoprotein F domain protein [Candida parapsilosis]